MAESVAKKKYKEINRLLADTVKKCCKIWKQEAKYDQYMIDFYVNNLKQKKREWINDLYVVVKV